MQRVLLARPNVHTADTLAFFPPLGILYLAAEIRARTPHSVALFDDWEVDGMAERFAARLATVSPDVVGISAMAPSAGLMHRLADVAKRRDPSVLVVAGGAHPTSSPEECIEDPAIDVVVLHEAERTFVSLLEAREAGRAIESVPGLVVRDATGRTVRTPPAPFLRDLDGLQRPAWQDVDLDFYWKRPSMTSVGPSRSLPVLTSRGCPFACIYCHGVMGKRYRTRSAADVLDEIAAMIDRHRVEAVEFVDDTFNFDRRRTEAILEGIVARRWNRVLRLRFPSGLRIDRLDPELLDLLKEAGTDYIVLGIESGSPRIQRLIRKNVDLDRAERLIRHAAGRGLFVAGFFMAGFPTETEAEIRATYEFAARSDLHQAMFYTAIPFPGTALAALLGRESRVPPGHVYNRSAFNLSAVPDARFQELRRQAIARFYGSPRRLWRIVRDYPNPRALPLYLPFMIRSVLRPGRTMGAGAAS